jgi:branched-chain amino acid aminotransferase
MDPASHIWSDGEMVAWDDATVHFLSHALQYGTGVFEGIRAYDTPEGTAVFRLNEHMMRLGASAAAYSIPLKWTAAELSEATLELLRTTGLDSAYIRPQVFYGLGTLGLDPTENEVHTMIGAFSFGTYLGEEGVNNGVTAMVSSWRRISHTSFVPTAKGSGGYLNSLLAKQEASRGGFGDAIMLNDEGLVAEGSGMNLFLVSRGVVHTPGVSAGILEGITRNTVIELLREDGIDVVESNIPRGSLYVAEEVFMTGTAAEVTPVCQIDGRTVGSGEPGPVTRQAQDLYHAAVNGKLDSHRDWLSFT